AGREQLERIGRLSGGDKAARVERVGAMGMLRLPPRTHTRWQDCALVKVVRVGAGGPLDYVYSVEVPGTHTFAINGGVFVHNCIPIDPFYLTWVARKHGMSTRFIELAGEVNTAMPAHIIRRVADALNDHGKALKGSKVCLLGMAYK